MSSPWCSNQASASCAGVVVEVVLGETRLLASPIIARQIVAAVDRAGEKAAAKRAVGDELGRASLQAQSAELHTQLVVMQLGAPTRMLLIPHTQRCTAAGEKLGSG